MVTWAALAVDRPQLMARARELFLIEQPDAPGPAGLGYLATIRPDGGPRVHPISPAVIDGRLHAFIIRTSPKAADLRLDPRFALHSWPKPFTDDGFDDEECYLAGTANLVEDEDLRRRVGVAVGDDPNGGDVYELDIDRAMHKGRVGGLGYETWRVPG
jgi:hypothetical protein